MWSSLKIGSVKGIGIFLHWTFGLLIVGVFAFFLIIGESPTTAFEFVLYLLALFVCVILHELGHALTAAIYNVPTRDITIYPIGGVARLQRIPEESMREFWIAVAGPAVNLAIAAVLAVIISAFGGSFAPQALLDPSGNPLASLMWLNLALVGFNMLPAFPMDGGRVLRSLLATRMEYSQATQIASSVGQGMAILFGILGLLWFNPILIFIALFVYVGAQQEARQATLRSATRGIPVKDAMMTRFPRLSPDDTLGRAVDELLTGAEHDFPIVSDGKPVGVLSRSELMKGLAEGGRDTRIGDVISGECMTVEANAMLEEAFAKLQENERSSMPVVQNNVLVGLLSLENVGEMMMISSALKDHESRMGKKLMRTK